jgi:hypothetical protein
LGRERRKGKVGRGEGGERRNAERWRYSIEAYKYYLPKYT